MAWLYYEILTLMAAVAFVYFWKTSHVFRYYVKFWYYYGDFLFTGVVVFPLALLRPRSIANIRPIQKWWNFTFSILGIKVVKKNEHFLVDSPGPGIVLVNHQSSLDIIGTMQTMPKNVTYLSKKEILYVGTFGIACWLCGLIFIDRLNPKSAHGTLERTAKTILDKKAKVLIFPEGTRNMSDTFLPFKKGAFYLAVRAQVPIYPVVLSTAKHFCDPKRKILNTGKIMASCLPPIETKGLTGDDVNKLSDDIRDRMLDEFHKINEELETEARSQGKRLLNDEKL